MQSFARDYYKENDNFYLNVTLEHPGINGIVTTNIVPAVGPPYTINSPTGIFEVNSQYNTTKTSPLLDKASDYYLSVIRFDIPLSEVPLYIMPIIPNQQPPFVPNPNLTPFIIGIEYNGVYTPINVIYTPALSLTPPVQNQPKQVITPYYYVYDYATLITMLNTALSQAYVASGVKALVDAAFVLSGGVGTMLTPFFFYSSESQLISLVVNKYFLKAGAGFLPFLPRIFVNAALVNFIDGFSFNGAPKAFSSIGADFVFDLENTGEIIDSLSYTPYQYFQNPIPAGIKPREIIIADYYQFTQDFVSVNYWTSLRKIIITSSSLPINKEYESAVGNSGVSISFPILADFVPQIEKPGDSRSIAYYVPSGQYKLVDLVSDQPIYKVDINIYWQDLDGNYYPLELSWGQQANVKLGFFRKSLYKSSIPLLRN